MESLIIKNIIQTVCKNNNKNDDRACVSEANAPHALACEPDILYTSNYINQAKAKAANIAFQFSPKELAVKYDAGSLSFEQLFNSAPKMAPLVPVPVPAIKV